MGERQFREDLFYRLSVIKIELPPLRERKEDIPLLADFFIKKYNTQHNKQVTGISSELLEQIYSLDWPGNVRELENFVDRAVALATGPILAPGDTELPTPRKPGENWMEHLPSNLTLDELETEYINHILTLCGDNYVTAAEILGINKSTLYRKLGRPRK